MQTAINYHTEVTVVPFGNGTITIESRTPILSPQERERRHREIEKQLFAIFSKYKKTEK